MAKVAPVGYIIGIGESRTMKHPFQIGDLLRSRMNRENLAIALRVYTMGGRPYLDVKYLRGDAVLCLPISRFTLLSR